MLRPSWRRFARGLEDPDGAQRAVLERIVAGLARTEYGRSFGILGRESYAEFRRRVPAVDYEDLRPWIERQASSRQPVLSPEPILLYEETSGSSGPRKLVPYTASILSSFDAMVRIWVYDLLTHGPGLTSGKTFISISPPVRERRTTPSGVPIGFPDDTGYLSFGTRRLLGGRFRFPTDLAGVRSWPMFRRALAAWLVSADDLEVLSVWSPTYLTTLMDWTSDHRERVLADLRAGRIEEEGVTVSLPVRSAGLPALGRNGPLDWARIWPRLKLISCWADGASGLFLPRLRREFPGVLIQPKGLLATEAPVTIPLCEAVAPVPLLGEVFLEFESSSGDVRLLHELEESREYTVLVSQAAGLVRYRLGDQVRCEGRVAGTPCLRFLGRIGGVTDLVGEKLHERFVREALRASVASAGDFAVLLPNTTRGRVARYVCLTDAPADEGWALSGALETALMAGMQYSAARGLGQLGPVEVCIRRDARDRYTRLFLERGMRWGDIKPKALLGPLSETELKAVLA
jgi:hypothetical protein